MKQLYLYAIALLVTATASAQIVNIPDAGFKARLISLGHDTNSDGQIQATEAAAVTTLTLGAPYNITDISGISSFTNLTALTVSGQPVQTLNLSSNNALLTVNASSCTALTYFEATNTEVTTIDISNCTALINFNCSDSNVSSLNVQGCTAIKILDCNYNNLTTLDVSSLSALINLSCESNNITSLIVTDKPNLVYLHANDNSLTTLTVSNLPSLVYLYCTENNLTSLTVSNLPNLVYLYCHDNNLTSLIVNNLPDLIILECYHNNLTTLDIAGLASLSSLRCYENQLSTLNLSGCPAITSIDCGYNNLQFLDVNACTALNNLFCDENPLTTLYTKNGRNDYISSMGDEFPQYICADESQILELQSDFPNASVSSYCTFEPGGNYNQLTGILRLDADSNGCTTADAPLQGFMVKIQSPTQTGFTSSNSQGVYKAYTGLGSVTVQPHIPVPGYFNFSPAASAQSFNTLNNSVTADFCITPNGTHPDLEVTILPVVPANPGFDALYAVHIKNKGNVVQSGTVSLQFNDAALDYLTEGSTGGTVTPGTITWDFTNLPLFGGQTFYAVFSVNSPQETPPVNVSDVLAFTAAITTAQTDETPADNTYQFNQVVIGSYDPNDKQVVQGPTISPAQATGYLDYIIRFQNTGTAPATFVVVKDILAASLDPATFVPVAASHPYRATLTSGNRVEFIFENINLPAEEDNEPASHGFIAFKVKPKNTVTVGSVIENTASIYFDYNLPIVTNTVSTTVATLMAGDFNFESQLTLYPNPAAETVTIAKKGDIAITSVRVYNMLGQLVLVMPNNMADSSIPINVASLKAGNYILEVISEKGRSAQKFIKK